MTDINNSLLIVPIIFFAAFIGADLFGGKGLDPTKVIAGILISALLGVFIYFVQNRKNKIK